MFLFAVWDGTGPQFFEGLGRAALPQVGLFVLFCGLNLASAYFLAGIFGSNGGGAAALIAGGLGSFTALGSTFGFYIGQITG